MTRSDIAVPKRQIPEFASREEEAHFWDTHNLTDYSAFTEPAEIEIAGPLSEPVTLHLDTETMEELRAIAADHNLPPDGLIHVRILELRDAERQRRGGMAGPPSDNPPGSVAPVNRAADAMPQREPTA